MELLEGETLRDRLGPGPLKLDTLLELGTQIADALETAHARGIVHRDIKPANIFVTKRGQAKLLDFGLAKQTEPEAGGSGDTALPTAMAEEHLTSPGTAIGTVAYMSPEQARGEPLDARTDIFSCGAVLYEMATGRQPFPGQTTAVIFEAILNRDAGLPGQAQPGAAGGARAHRQHGPREGPGPPLPEHRGPEDGPEAAQARLRLGEEREDRRGRAGSGAARASPAIGRSPPSRRPACSPPEPSGWWAAHRRGASPSAGGQTTLAVLPFQNLGADPSTDYLRLALPDEVDHHSLVHPHAGDPSLRGDAEIREGRRGSAGRRQGAPCGRRPHRPLPERRRPAPRDARGRRHGVEPFALARFHDRRRDGPHRPSRGDLRTHPPGSLPASGRLGRRGRYRNAAEEPRGLRPLPAQQAHDERRGTQQAGARDARALRGSGSRLRARVGRAFPALLLRGAVRRRVERRPGSLRVGLGEGIGTRPQSDRGVAAADRPFHGGREPPRRRREGPRPPSPPAERRRGALQRRVRASLCGPPRRRGARVRRGSGPRSQKPRVPVVCAAVHPARRICESPRVRASGCGIGLVDQRRGGHSLATGQVRGRDRHHSRQRQPLPRIQTPGYAARAGTRPLRRRDGAHVVEHDGSRECLLHGGDHGDGGISGFDAAPSEKGGRRQLPDARKPGSGSRL